AETEARRHPRQIRQGVVRVADPGLTDRVVWPGRRRLHIGHVVAEAAQANGNLHVHPGHASVWVGSEGPQDHNTTRGHLNLLTLHRAAVRVPYRRQNMPRRWHAQPWRAERSRLRRPEWRPPPPPWS